MTEKPEPKKVRPPFVHTDQAPLPAQEGASQPQAWVQQVWRAFDWRSAASLRAPEKAGAKADLAWDSTVWGDTPGALSPEARRVAEQLDVVAQQIRKGELSVDGKAPTPETAVAAALEALIRNR